MAYASVAKEKDLNMFICFYFEMRSNDCFSLRFDLYIIRLHGS